MTDRHGPEVSGGRCPHCGHTLGENGCPDCKKYGVKKPKGGK